MPINTTYLRKIRWDFHHLLGQRELSLLPPNTEGGHDPARAFVDGAFQDLACYFGILRQQGQYDTGPPDIQPVTASLCIQQLCTILCHASCAFLAGQRVPSLLAATIRPRSRTLKFRVSIPRLIPGDLPPSFPSDFLIRPVQLPSRWGGGTIGPSEKVSTFYSLVVGEQRYCSRRAALSPLNIMGMVWGDPLVLGFETAVASISRSATVKTRCVGGLCGILLIGLPGFLKGLLTTAYVPTLLPCHGIRCLAAR